MRSFGITVFVMTVAVAVVRTGSIKGGGREPTSQQQEKAENTGNLEGRWSVVSGTVDGDEQDFRGAKVTIAKSLFTLEERDGEVQKATFKVDTSPNPNHVDFTATEGRQKGEVLKGILIFKGNRLTFCLARTGENRPTEASSTEGSGHILLVLEPAKVER